MIHDVLNAAIAQAREILDAVVMDWETTVENGGAASRWACAREGGGGSALWVECPAMKDGGLVGGLDRLDLAE